MNPEKGREWFARRLEKEWFLNSVQDSAGTFSLPSVFLAFTIQAMKQLLCLLALFSTWIPIPSPAADAPEPSPVPLVAFRAVHPDNDRLVAEGKPCPAGYTPYIYGFRNCQG